MRLSMIQNYTMDVGVDGVCTPELLDWGLFFLLGYNIRAGFAVEEDMKYWDSIGVLSDIL